MSEVLGGYFDPIDAAGYQAFAQTAEAAGWYQFTDPAATLPQLAGLVIPQDAEGIFIQAVTDLEFCLSPASTAGNPVPMTLPALGTLVLSGRRSLRNFCVKLPAAGGAFVIQWQTGAVGPQVLINLPRQGAPGPPGPPGGLSQVVIAHTIHVMKNGNDGSGTRERLDLPFVTITAAEAVALPGDEIVIWGHVPYAEGGFTKVDISYRLMGAIIQTPTTEQATFEPTTPGTIRISGNGQLNHDGNAGSPTFVILGAEDVHFDIDADLNNAEGSGIGADAGTITLRGNITVNGRNAYGLNGFDQATVYGNIVATGSGSEAVHQVLKDAITTIHGNANGDLMGVYQDRSGQSVTIFGNVFGTNGVGAQCADGIQTIFGNCSSTFGEGAICVAGEQVIHGEVSSPANAGARCIGGAQTIHGNVVTIEPVGSYAAAECNGGRQEIHGNAVGNIYAGAASFAGIQVIHGDATTIDGYGALCFESEQTIHGNAISGSGIGAGCITGIQSVRGNAISNDEYAAYCETNGVQVIGGNATSQDNLGAYAVNDATQTIKGNATSTNAVGAQAEGNSIQVIYGDATSGATVGAVNTASAQTIHGDVIGITFGSLNNEDATTTIHGDVLTTGATTAGVQTTRNTARLKVMGNITTTNGPAAHCLDGTIQLYGDTFSENSHGILCNAGIVTSYGDNTSEGVITDANGAIARGGRVFIHGNCYSVAGAAAKTQNGGFMVVFGNVHSVQRWGAFVFTGGELIIHGDASSDQLPGAWLQGLTFGNGIMRLYGRTYTNATGEHAVIVSAGGGNVLDLMASARLEAGATSLYSVDIDGAGTETINSYQASGNLIVGPGVTVNGTFNVIT